MIVDTSAIITVIAREPLSGAVRDRLRQDAPLRMSAATVAELLIVADNRFGRSLKGDAERFLVEAGVDVVPFGSEDARRAADAYAAFGKGNHPARLNMGDCFAYALAKTRDEPLLFKGDDFTHTDVRSAL